MISARRSIAVPVAGAVVLAVSLCALTATALAAVSYESETTVLSGGADRVSADCAGRSRTIGGGVRLMGSPGSTASTTAPFDGPRGNREPDDGWTAGGGSSDVDFLTAFAICSDRGGFRYVKSKPKRVNNRSVTARCGRGYRVIGGGVSTTRSSNLISLLQSVPVGAATKSKNDDGWKGAANNASNFSSELRVFAICSKSARVKEQTQTILSNSALFNSVLDCPSGFTTTGGGGEFEGVPNGAYLLSSFPGDTTDSSDPSAIWTNQARNGTGLSQRFTAHALCTKF